MVFDSLINAHWPTELLALCYVGNGQIKKSLGYALYCRNLRTSTGNIIKLA